MREDKPRVRALSAGLRLIWQARRSPSPWVRGAWWLSLIALIVLAASGPNRPVVFALLLGLLNGGILAVGGLWGLFHWRSLRAAKQIIRGFGIVMALLAAFLVLALQDVLTSFVPNLILSDSTLLLIALVVFPIALPVCWLAGALGASIGTFCGRYEADSSHSARYGVFGWWLAFWVGGMLLAQNLRSPIVLAVWGSAPLLACLAALLAPYVRVNNVGLLRRIVRFLDRRLRRRVRFRGRTRTLDMRGAFLGLLAGLFLLVSGLMGIFGPVQARLLALLVEFRSAPVLSQVPELAIGRLLDERKDRAQMQALVVLTMDGATRRRIVQSGSETAVQARMIRLLAKYGCRTIVLPAPLLNPDWQALLPPTLDTPRIGSRTDARGLQDLPELTQAIRQAGNVILSVPDIYHPSLMGMGPPPHGPLMPVEEHLADLRTLAQAASGVGYAELPNLYSGRLPAIPLYWQGIHLETGRPGEIPPLPVVLFSALRGVPLASTEAKGNPRIIRLGGETLPVTQADEILVSYFAGEPGTAFPTLDYRTLLEGNAATLLPKIARLNDPGGPDMPPDGSANWMPMRDFFKDKIVFLDSLDSRTRQTPIGNLSEPELMANATATLLTRSIVRRLLPLPMQQALFTALIFAALIGHLTMRRTPLQAVWLALLVASAFVVLCLVSFLFAHVWIDMLLPLLAGVLAYVLVVQYTFAVDKWEVSQNRELLERFLDKNTVNQILAHGYALELGGVRKRVCVLFADVRGFSRFAASHPPEEVIQTINQYLTAMSEQVFRFDGMLDKFLGDGMLALFGIPEARADDAERAVRAALAMQEEAERISQRLVQEGRQPLALGIGLHCGDAVFGLVGSVRRPDLTAIGHTVVVGQRLQAIAQAGEIILSAEFRAELAHLVEAQERPPVQVKGLPGQIVCHRLLCLSKPEASESSNGSDAGAPAVQPAQ